MNLLVGADPELFLKRNGQYISAFGLVPGSKREPHLVDKGAIQADGNAAEINIDPAGSKAEFVHGIDYVLQQLRAMIPEDVSFDFSAIADFGQEYMDSLPDEAKLLGCDPDFNAWTETQNPSPEAHPTMRAAGGHVHLGWTNDQAVGAIDHFKSCCTLIKQMDYCIGLPSLLLDPDTKRREMYGKAGAFRPKPYGAEYRTPSNFWFPVPDLRELVYENAQQGFKMLVEEQRNLVNEFGNAARECIDNNDRAQAAYLCDAIGIRSKV